MLSRVSWQCQENFYPRPPRGGRREVLGVCLASLFISIHALREEGDQVKNCIISSIFNFYPRPLRGGRLYHAVEGNEKPKFLYTPSARRATLVRFNVPRGSVISIHALCEEGDLRFPMEFPRVVYFYPRPLRGGRLCSFCIRVFVSLFLSTPSARRATAPASLVNFLFLFLSTPSARRATTDKKDFERFFKISIHALCEEGDYSPVSPVIIAWHFYPRPLRGGRRIWV